MITPRMLQQSWSHGGREGHGEEVRRESTHDVLLCQKGYLVKENGVAIN